MERGNCHWGGCAGLDSVSFDMLSLVGASFGAYLNYFDLYKCV